MIKSVQKAMQILTILSDSPDAPVRLSDVARQMGLNESTCAHLLETMCDCGVAERVSRADGYRVGVHAYYITRNGRYQDEIVKLGEPVLKWMKNKTGHSMVLVTLKKKHKVVLCRVSGINVFTDSRPSAYYESLYRYSTSHAILAEMDPVEREEFYAVNGYPTPEEWPGLYEAGGPQKAYDEIRQRGYELFRFPYDAPEAREGEMVVGMAKAVKNGNQVVAALGVALPNEHGYRCFEGSQQQWYLTKAEEEFIGKYLCMAVREIQRRMQF